MIYYSIIICTYNPDERILARSLKAISTLLLNENIKREIIIVDNNSTNPVEELSIVKSFIIETCAKILIEKRQGLTFARMAGLKNAQGQYIVFFDDDNEPNESYLIRSNGLITEYKNVAVWGPGNIAIDFIDKTDNWATRNMRGLYQEKVSDSINIGHDPFDPNHRPDGTGMVVNKDILDKYSVLVDAGRISTTDRSGNSLASCGDRQITYLAIKLGYDTGLSHNLLLTHIIPEKRTKIRYIIKLIYGFTSTSLKAKEEIFGKNPSKNPSIISYLNQIVVDVFRFRYSLNGFLVSLAGKTGKTASFYIAKNCDLPLIIRLILKLFKMQ